MITEILKELNTQLRKHPDVTSVLVLSDNIKKEFTDQLIYNIDSETFYEASLAFVTNIEMLSALKIEHTDENMYTVNVLRAARRLNELTPTQVMAVKSIDDKLFFIETASMLVIFCVNCQITRRISTIMDKDLQMNMNSSRLVYRGHTDASYKLIPSLYRNLKLTDGYGVVNISMLKSLYSSSGLSDKYNAVFGSNNIDYNFCAFAQHAKSYSPFLDFTYDANVALSFAVSKTNSINDYLQKNAALFTLSFNDSIETKHNISLSSIDVFINEKRITPFAKIRDKELYKCTYYDFYVEAFLLEEKTNDRMKYQKGCFLYFQRAVIINGNLLIPINFGRIKKYIIPTSGRTLNKFTIYDKIRSDYKYYLPDYLMNPYKYFEEAPL